MARYKSGVNVPAGHTEAVAPKKRGRPPGGAKALRIAPGTIVQDEEGNTIHSSSHSPERIVISAPAFATASVLIKGDTPLVLHKFSQKVQQKIRETQEAGSVARKGKQREARDFEANFQAARHVSQEGWDGIPASAFRNAMISACRTVGFKMTIAKMSVFTLADGFDEEGNGLVKITKGQPKMDVRPGRNATGGIDLRSRPMWQPGWEAKVTFRWDSAQFSASDILNLLARAGMQVGVGEGRADSKMSAGVGWGHFSVVGIV